jgi:hypothetical protein
VSVLIITYAHNNPQKDYAPFFDAVKGNCDYWWYYLNATWIVVTDHSANDFAKLLYPHIETTDRLLVAKLAGDHQGWLPEDAWKWLNEKQY